MEKQQLELKILEMEKSDLRFIRKLRKDEGGLATKTFLLLIDVLKFARDFGYNDKGKKVKLNIWNFITKKKLRKEAGRIISRVFDVFGTD